MASINWEKIHIELDVPMTSCYKMDLHLTNSSAGASAFILFLVSVTFERAFKRLNEPFGLCIQG